MRYLNHTVLIKKKIGVSLMQGKTLTFPAPVRNKQTSSEDYDLPQDSIRLCSNFHAHESKLICKWRNKLKKQL